MPVLADIDGQVIFLIIALVIALINWLTNKGDADKPDTAPSPKFPRLPKPSADAEAERMRKFMEALGLPTDQPAEPPRPAPAPKPPKPFHRQPPPAAPPPLPPARPVETVHVPELRTTPVREFRTRAAEVTALPALAAEPDAYLTPADDGAARDLRTLLRSPRDVRVAFLVREILGPPRSLQT